MINYVDREVGKGKDKREVIVEIKSSPYPDQHDIPDRHLDDGAVGDLLQSTVGTYSRRKRHVTSGKQTLACYFESTFKQ